MSTRRKQREQVLKMLYQLEVGKGDAEDVFFFYLEEEKPEVETSRFVKALFFGVTEKTDELDKKIEEFADNWKLSRIALVDKNVLRMSLYEIIYCDDIPNAVAINEAVDIVKKFSTEDSGKFVNGLLDKIKNELAKKGS